MCLCFHTSSRGTFSHFQLIAQMFILYFDSSCAALECNIPGRKQSHRECFEGLSLFYATELPELTLTERDVTHLCSHGSDIANALAFVGINNRCSEVALCIPVDSFLAISSAFREQKWRR